MTDYKVKVDIAKTKLLFFSAIVGGTYGMIEKFSITFLVYIVLFILSIIGVLVNFKKLNDYEKGVFNVWKWTSANSCYDCNVCTIIHSV